MKKLQIVFWIITTAFVLSLTTLGALVPDSDSGTNNSNNHYQCDENGSLIRCSGQVDCVNVQGANFDCVRNKCVYKGSQGPCSDGTPIGQCSKNSPGLRCIEGPLGSPSLAKIINDPCCTGGTTPTTQPYGCNNDGWCNPAYGETIQNCPGDCTCNNDGKCDPPTETPETCQDCKGITPSDNDDAAYFKNKTISVEEYNRIYFIIYQDRIANGTKFTDDELSDILEYSKSNNDEKDLSGKLYTTGSKSNEIIGDILTRAGANFGTVRGGSGGNCYMWTDVDGNSCCHDDTNWPGYCYAGKICDITTGYCESSNQTTTTTLGGGSGCYMTTDIDGETCCHDSTNWPGFCWPNKICDPTTGYCTSGGTTTTTSGGTTTTTQSTTTCNQKCTILGYSYSYCAAGSCYSGDVQSIGTCPTGYPTCCCNNGWTTTTAPSTTCTDHSQCSQTCSTSCPKGVYGCCSGCQIGQCQGGQCVCYTSTSYCSSPAYQVGAKCQGGTTTTTPPGTCYDSDGGKNYLTPGICSDGGTPVKDTCSGTDILVESYCNTANGNCNTYGVSCSAQYGSGYRCITDLGTGAAYCSNVGTTTTTTPATRCDYTCGSSGYKFYHCAYSSCSAPFHTNTGSCSGLGSGTCCCTNCGNGYCSATDGETAQNCPQDCAKTTTTTTPSTTTCAQKCGILGYSYWYCSTGACTKAGSIESIGTCPSGYINCCCTNTAS